MSTTQVCPISGVKGDNTAARLTAGFVLILGGVDLALGLLGLLLPAGLLAAFMALDFLARAFLPPRYSLLALGARGLAAALKLKKVMTDKAPKVFAARVGLAFTLAAALLFGLSLPLAAAGVLGVLLLCAALEAFLGFCVGCWMYGLFPPSLGNFLIRGFRA